jgi:hypothetical protein
MIFNNILDIVIGESLPLSIHNQASRKPDLMRMDPSCLYYF